MHDNKFFNDLRPAAAAYWAALVATAVIIFAAWVALRYANQPLLEAYGFRQTQTALTSFWMIREGWQLAYQTPVAGYPWSIPFEFPFFQALAALISSGTGYPLDACGRLLSFSFLIACAWPVMSIMRRLALPSKTAWIFCALLWSSPIYLFWGRAFLMETAALFFVLMAIPYAMDLNIPRPAWRSALLFAFWGAMGMLQKVTTAAPVLMTMGLVLAISHFKTAGFRLPSARQIICIGVAFTIPLVVGLWWTHYTDLIKEQNPLGTALTSKALTQWNFGTLDQRLDPVGLRTLFWNRVIAGNIAGLFGVFLIAGALSSGEQRVRSIISICLILFALPLLVFTNLHRIHSYYQVSSAVFLLGALSIALVLWLPKLIEQSVLTPAILALLALTSLLSFGIAKTLFFDAFIENLKQNQSSAWGMALLLAGGIIFGKQRLRKVVLLAPLAFVLLIVVMTNTYHAYNSSSKFPFVFLTGALVTVSMLFLPVRIHRPAIVPIVTLLLVFTNLFHFSTGYASMLWDKGGAQQTTVLELASMIRQNTPEDSGLVVFGADWSSEIAYYAQRKSFTVSDWFKGYDNAWNAPASFLGGRKLGAIVFCLNSKISLEKIMEQPDVKGRQELHRIDNCYLWLARNESTKMAHPGSAVMLGESKSLFN